MVQLIVVDQVLEDSLRRSFFETAPENDRESISVGKAAAGPL
jgi:hypothetical protein